MFTDYISQPRVRSALAAALVLTCISIGAEFLAADRSRADPPVPPAEAVIISGARPAPTLQYTEMAPGLLARSVFATRDVGPFGIEILDILVGPGQNVQIPAAQFAALLEVKAGAPAISVDGKSAATEPGQLLGVDQGRSLAIDNRQGERAVVARLIKVQAPKN